MQFKARFRQIPIPAWVLWAIVCCVALFATPTQAAGDDGVTPHLPALTGVVTHDPHNGWLVPWRPLHRPRRWWRNEALRRVRRVIQRAQRCARWLAFWTGLALKGALTMATVVDLLTRAQLRRHVGALPVLYALLESLQVRQIINRHCPTAAEVDHGTVAMVLILNRLAAPRPLYRVADRLARTVLVHTLGVPVNRFNDDRLGRTLEAIGEHARDIWQDVVHRALVQADVDLRVIFYDLTAFVVHGTYEGSDLADFGFAHNTPLDKRKVKLGLNVTGDGGIPTAYDLWAGRMADMATVAENMARLAHFLEAHGWSVEETIIIGDRANLNDELVFAYNDHRLRYLAGLQPQKKAHRQLLTAFADEEFYAHPLTDERGRAAGYWGVPCPVTFEHAGRRMVQRGLVVLSGPMRAALRQERAAQLWELRGRLIAVRAQIGKRRYRSVESVQKHAETQLRRSPVGKLLRVQACADEQGKVGLRWWIDREALRQAGRHDGRYLLVTNDRQLSPRRMFELYRDKDKAEKRFRVCKSDLRSHRSTCTRTSASQGCCSSTCWPCWPTACWSGRCGRTGCR